MADVLCTKANPHVIRWARKEMQVTIEDAAHTLRLEAEEYASLESGDSTPTLKQLRKMALKYKRPVALFFLPAAPASPREPKDYRRGGSNKGIKLKLSFRKARRVQEYLEELGLEDNATYPTLSSDSASEAASTLRHYLGLTMGKQLEGSDPKTLFAVVQAKLQADGISVLMHSWPRGEARAYSFADFPKVIVITTNDSVQGARNFSIIHEMTHIGLGRSGLCSVTADRSRYATERFCDKVAVEFLMPEGTVRELVKTIPKTEILDDSSLSRVANRLKTSRFALLIRFLELGIVTDKQFQVKQAEWASRTSSGRGRAVATPARVINENGVPLTRIAMEGFASGQVPPIVVSKILNVNQSYLDAVGDRISSG